MRICSLLEREKAFHYECMKEYARIIQERFPGEIPPAMRGHYETFVRAELDRHTKDYFRTVELTEDFTGMSDADLLLRVDSPETGFPWDDLAKKIEP